MIQRLQLISSDGEIMKVKDKHFTDAMNAEGYRMPSHKSGARMFSNVKFPQSMNDSDIGKMARLSKIMIGKTNMLGYRKGRQILPYTAQEIGKLVGLNKDRPARDFVNKMVRIRLMQKIDIDGKSQYYINPAYFMSNGQRLSLDLFLLFRDELTDLVPEWVLLDFLRQAKEKQV